MVCPSNILIRYSSIPYKYVYGTTVFNILKDAYFRHLIKIDIKSNMLILVSWD